MSRQWTLLSFAFLLGAAMNLSAQIQPGELRCEYRVNPLGIDSVVPRLSWISTAPNRTARSLSQSAYQIIAASTAANLDKNQGDLWDTGKVNSAQSVHVLYAGKPLHSGEPVFWKVRVWDQDSKGSAWSETARWSMGLLQSSDWKAQWIGKEETGTYQNLDSPFQHLKAARWIWAPGNGSQTFRAKFTVPAGRKLDRAICIMSAEKSFALTFNGTVVGQQAAVSEPFIWDVTRLVKTGINNVEVTAEPSVRNASALIGIIRLEWESGDPLTIATDRSTWTAASGSVIDKGPFGTQPWGDVGFVEERALPARLLRKEFNAHGPVKRAVAYLSGLGLSELYLNGHKIGDQVLSPNLTDYDKRVHYVTYDVTNEMKAGKNAVGIMLGNGRYWAPRTWYPIPTKNYGPPKARMELHIEYADGQTDSVLTDKTWKLSTDGPIRANNEYDGEEYDAQKELPGWSASGFNDSAWPSAQVVSAPSGVMVAQMAEPLRVVETVKPVKVTRLRPGVYVFDLGQNMVGWCRLHVSGPKGTRVQLRHAETLRENGELYVDNLRSARATDIYTLRGEGREAWEPRFTYHGFRYVELRGYPGVPTLQTLEGRVVQDDMSKTADFVSSNKLLNQIHHGIYWGVRGNYRSIPTDCPQRDERQGWLGDRSVVCRSESYLFNVAAFYTKWETDLADAQQPTGSVPDVAPAYWNLYNDDITWPSTFLQVPAMLYDQYGDLRVIERNYAAMKKWVEHMRPFLHNGIIAKDTYADWCVPPENPKLIHSKDPARQTDGTLLATAYYYWMTRQLARFAMLLGNKPMDQKNYSALADGIKTAFNNTFLNPKTGLYGNGTQTSGIVPLSFGLVPPENKKTVFDGLIRRIENESRGHVGTGLIGAQWLMRALTENGRPDVAFQIATQTTYPGWGYMLSKGATTIWELWNGDTADPAMNSGNHVMQIGDLGVWMYEYLGGIRPDPDHPGFKHILIHPYPVKELSFVKTSHRSLYGLISAEWKRAGNGISLNVTVPPNTSATVWVPAAQTAKVLESGHPAEKSPGVKELGRENGMVVFEVQSGAYSFSSGA